MRLRSRPRRGPKRSGYLVKAVTPPSGLVSRPHVECGACPHPKTATTHSAAGRRGPVIDADRQVAGSTPARSTRAPVAQWTERFRPHTTTAAALPARAGETRLSHHQRIRARVHDRADAPKGGR